MMTIARLSTLLLLLPVAILAFPTGPGACAVGSSSAELAGNVHEGFDAGSLFDAGVTLAFDGVPLSDGMSLMAEVKYAVTMSRLNGFSGFLLRMDEGVFEDFTAIVGGTTTPTPELIQEPAHVCVLVDPEFASVGHDNPDRLDLSSIQGTFQAVEAGTFQLDVNVVVGVEEWFFSTFTVDVIVQPSGVPSDSPSLRPSDVPSDAPSALPSGGPSPFPSFSPTVIASTLPSMTPSSTPTITISELPTVTASNQPTLVESDNPTSSTSPSHVPSTEPSISVVECPPNQFFNETSGKCRCDIGLIFLGFGCICFSGSTSVVTQDKGSIMMKDLEIGDYVQVSEHKFEPVYSFGHYSATGLFEYLVFNDGGLEISSDHMVAVEGRGFVPAGMVKVGDVLVTSAAASGQVVQTIKKTVSEGAFAPFTPSGTILVNDVLASSFVALGEADHPSLRIGSVDTGLSWHLLAFAWEFPHRLACHYFGRRCSNESYNSKGVSGWVATPHEFGKWWINQSLYLNMFVTPLVLLYLGFLLLAESMLTSPTGAILAACAALGVLNYRRHDKK